ncbi:hypothetical protein ACP70R_036195 [Stipagrostis hirtigluma subsp. patula]
MAEQEAPECSACCYLICAAIVLIPAIVCLSVFVFASKGPAYSVAVSGVAGLDPAADLTAAGRPTLSPVFNVTVRIDNARDRTSSACVGRLSTVAVSYGDALLGKGSVPEFCAKERKVQERGARAWGQDVVLPRFLRDQLAGELAVGEAAVDVKVTTPADCHHCGDTVLICNNVKIGGGPSPCKLHSVYAPPAAGSG